MRTLSSVLALAVAILLCAGPGAAPVGAQEKVVGVVLVERIQDINLTDDQEAKIAEIRKDCQPKIRDAAKELTALVKEEVEKVRDVLTPEQKAKLQELKEELKEQRMVGLAERIAHLKELDLTLDEVAKIQEIRKEFRPKIVKGMQALAGMLSDEQKQAREQGLKAGKKRAEVLASLNLTADQKEKVAAVCKDVGVVVREELEKIKDLLTDEQQAKLVDIKEERLERVRDRLACKIANFKDLNLTDEQKTKIEAIRKDFRPRVHEAGNRLRAAVRDEVAMIVAVIK
jgi:Spy/CpxP family protein refolding chaperone